MNNNILLDTREKDGVSGVLKWILLFVAIFCFAVIGWGTYITYQQAPPLPENFLSPTGQVVMSRADIIAGKAGFQQADLMDFGSLYGMGSYFGEDYTAQYLVKLGQLTEKFLSQQQFGQPFSQLNKGNQYIIQQSVKKILKTLPLDQLVLNLSPSLTNAIEQLQANITQSLLMNNFAAGWTKAYSLNVSSAKQVADFLIYSSLTTVANRPGKNFSYTNNWPYEPSVGNTPTTETFIWTWASFCLVFFGFGAVLFIYHYFLNEEDTALKTHLFNEFKKLLPSQIKTGQYFIVVALILLLQTATGAILAHYYSDRASFYGINIAPFLPFNFLRDVHIQTPIVWIGLSWISSALFLTPLISGKEAKGQSQLVTLLFWITLFIVAGALLGDYLGIMGIITKHWFWIGNQGLSYIQLGRLWQIGFAAGLILWSVM
ncbi:MAG: nitric oxide reductase, partial [Gammaproteobacteria bacterium]|nr:nitric oxide reductase [Gammaproteobacteria bacterium]